MKKKVILAAVLCLTASLPSAYAAKEAGSDAVQRVQQNGKRITGKVIDNTGEPVIGASVTVKGTTNGTITDMDGNFTLDNASGTLVVSFIGYSPVEVNIGGKTSFTVTLREDDELLDEVVVVGYGVQKKASLTSAISQVRGEEVFANRGITNATTALQGEVP